MDRQQQIRELESAMYPENRYLQNKICFHLEGLSKNNNKEVSTTAVELLKRAKELKEPYNFQKELEHPQNIGQLYDVYDETISLIQNNLL